MTACGEERGALRGELEGVAVFLGVDGAGDGELFFVLLAEHGYKLGIAGVCHSDFSGEEVLEGFGECFVEVIRVFDAADVYEGMMGGIDANGASDFPVRGGRGDCEDADAVAGEGADEDVIGVGGWLSYRGKRGEGCGEAPCVIAEDAVAEDGEELFAEFCVVVWFVEGSDGGDAEHSESEVADLNGVHESSFQECRARWALESLKCRTRCVLGKCRRCCRLARAELTGASGLSGRGRMRGERG